MQVSNYQIGCEHYKFERQCAGAVAFIRHSTAVHLFGTPRSAFYLTAIDWVHACGWRLFLLSTQSYYLSNYWYASCHRSLGLLLSSQTPSNTITVQRLLEGILGSSRRPMIVLLGVSLLSSKPRPRDIKQISNSINNVHQCMPEEHLQILCVIDWFDHYNNFFSFLLSSFSSLSIVRFKSAVESNILDEFSPSLRLFLTSRSVSFLRAVFSPCFTNYYY